MAKLQHSRTGLIKKKIKKKSCGFNDNVVRSKFELVTLLRANVCVFVHSVDVDVSLSLVSTTGRDEQEMGATPPEPGASWNFVIEELCVIVATRLPRRLSAIGEQWRDASPAE